MQGDLLGLDLNGPARPAELPPEDRALAAGLGAGVASAIAAVAMRYLFRAPFVPERVADFVFAVMPISIVEAGVALLGPYAKRFAFAGCVAAYFAILAYAGRLFAKYRPTPRALDGLLFGALLWLAASLTIFPAIGGGAFGIAWKPGPVAAPAALLATALVYGATLAWLVVAFAASDRLARRGATFANRRAAINTLVTVGVATVAFELGKSVVAFFGIGANARVKNGSGVFPDVDGLSREVTPTADFYHISKNVFDPDGPPDDWTLEVGGAVANARSYTLDELRALPAAEAHATLMCISNWVGGDLIGNAFWRGVPMASILEAAGVGEGAVDLVFTAFDDYTDSIPIERALAPGTLLAYEMNGEPLTATHGAPLRAIVPGIYGMKNVKWIKKLEVVAKDYKGYWQRRGWDDKAPYQTMSRVDVARASGVGKPAVVAGVAFAGDRGIGRVEVSTDGGKTWADAELRPPLSGNAWVLWHLDWVPDRAGKHTVVARATDGTGDVQTNREAPPAPSGSTGWHRVSLDIPA